MKICTVIGARPQFVKAAVVSAEIAKHDQIEEIIIHTGQHYDKDMSDIFFSELSVPREKYNLGVGSGNHGEQTGKMLSGIEDVLQREKPDWVLIYGDTNSTVAGSLAAVKLHIPVAHVEAGMRSFNRTMPEEVNRVVADHICDLNLCSTKAAMDNLELEGRGFTAQLVGDVMYDCVLKFSEIAEKSDPTGKLLNNIGVEPEKYILMTCHRAENTNDVNRLVQIVEGVNKIAEKLPVVYPIHPRTKGYLQRFGIDFSDNVKIISPVSYFEMILLTKNSNMVLTDSGGVQKEAFFHTVPCITMRDETEWGETIEMGWNRIVGADKEKIFHAFEHFSKVKPVFPDIMPYGDGNASEKVVSAMLKWKRD